MDTATEDDVRNECLGVALRATMRARGVPDSPELRAEIAGAFRAFEESPPAWWRGYAAAPSPRMWFRPEGRDGVHDEWLVEAMLTLGAAFEVFTDHQHRASILRTCRDLAAPASVTWVVSGVDIPPAATAAVMDSPDPVVAADAAVDTIAAIAAAVPNLGGLIERAAAAADNGRTLHSEGTAAVVARADERAANARRRYAEIRRRLPDGKQSDVEARRLVADAMGISEKSVRRYLRPATGDAVGSEEA